ncbi:hypothetical protein WA538_004620 [Blastocystis sp. DL]
MDKGKELASFRIPRYKILLAMIQFYVITYIVCLFGPVQYYLDPFVLKLIAWSPLVSLVLFGAFAAFTILRNVIRLKNYPEEAESLLKDVAEAKAGLKKMGYKYELSFVC